MISKQETAESLIKINKVPNNSWIDSCEPRYERFQTFFAKFTSLK